MHDYKNDLNIPEESRNGMDLNKIIQETIKQRLYRINREEVMSFCTEHCTSENILFLTAFNI